MLILYRGGINAKLLIPLKLTVSLTLIISSNNFKSDDMIKGLIFDLDGTIIDITNYIPIFTELQIKALHRCNGNKGLKLGIKECYEPLRLPSEESNRLLQKIWNVDPKKYWKEVFQLDMEARRMAIKDGTLKCFEDVSILRELKNNFKIILFSNTPKEIAELELNYFKISDLFPTKVYGFYKCEISKPETKGITMCLKELGLLAKETVMIGDSDVDISMGKKIGMKTIRIDRGHYSYGGEKPDLVIRTLNELKGVLNEMQLR